MRPSSLWTAADSLNGHVSCGPPLGGTSVEVSNTGELLVDSPSLFSGYLTADGFSPSERPFPTADVGQLHNGELYIFGRNDDVIQKSGRKIFPGDVEGAIGTITGVAACVALGTGEEVFVVCEVRSSQWAVINRKELEVTIKERVVHEVGIGPRVVFVPSGHVPRTPSGKPRRKELAGLIQQGLR